MASLLTDEHIESYHHDGYCIFRQIIPADVLGELREIARQGRPIARQNSGPQAQRLQPISKHLDVAAYIRFTRQPDVQEAIGALLGPEARYGAAEPDKLKAGIFYEPAEHAWCTQWHRDWRDNVPGLDIDAWRQRRDDVRYFNQINMPLYEDTCTWIVPGSHNRDDLPREVARFPNRPVGGPELEGLSPEARERAVINYARSMPGAVRVNLDAGDMLLYRNTLWHIGVYLPYRVRATLHDSVFTDAFEQWFESWPKRPDGEKGFMNPNAPRQLAGA